MVEVDRKKRSAPRVPYSHSITVAGGDGRSGEGKLRNLSVDGAAADVSINFREDERVTLRVPEIGTFAGTVRRCKPPTLNIQFDNLSHQDKEAIADFLQVQRVLFGQ